LVAIDINAFAVSFGLDIWSPASPDGFSSRSLADINHFGEEQGVYPVHLSAARRVGASEAQAM